MFCVFRVWVLFNEWLILFLFLILQELYLHLRYFFTIESEWILDLLRQRRRRPRDRRVSVNCTYLVRHVWLDIPFVWRWWLHPIICDHYSPLFRDTFSEGFLSCPQPYQYAHVAILLLTLVDLYTDTSCRAGNPFNCSQGRWKCKC